MTQSEITTLEQLKERLNDILYSDKCTPSFRRLAQFLLANYNNTAFMTAAEIAAEAKVSQPTVTRFVNTMLGFKGYAQFIKLVQELVRIEITGVDRYQIISDKHTSTIEEMINRDIQNVSRILEEIPEEKLHRVANQIAEKETVVIIGLRTASHLANYFYFFLNKIHPDVQLCVKEGIEAYELLNRIDKEKAIVLAFVFPRYSNSIINIIQYLKEREFNYITISDNNTLELWGVTECTIVTPISITSLFDSFAATYSVLNILLNLIGKANVARTEKMLEESEKLFKEKDFFYKKKS